MTKLSIFFVIYKFLDITVIPVVYKKACYDEQCNKEACVFMKTLVKL